MKKSIRRIGIALAAAAVVSALVYHYFWFYIDEFAYKVNCVDKMVDTYKNDVNVRNAFEYVNKEISDSADSENTDLYEIILPYSAELSENPLLGSNISLISENYSFLRNGIYMVAYDSGNVYYVFEESEYIFVSSDSRKPDISCINSEDDYMDYALGNDMYLFVKLQYYD